MLWILAWIIGSIPLGFIIGRALPPRINHSRTAKLYRAHQAANDFAKSDGVHPARVFNLSHADHFARKAQQDHA